MDIKLYVRDEVVKQWHAIGKNKLGRNLEVVKNALLFKGGYKLFGAGENL